MPKSGELSHFDSNSWKKEKGARERPLFPTAYFLGLVNELGTLLEAANRLGLVVKRLKNRVELGDLQKILDAL